MNGSQFELIDNDSYCNNLSQVPKASDEIVYKYLTQDFSIKSCSLSLNISVQCNTDIINFFNGCFKDLMGLNIAYTSSETSNDRSTSNWKFLSNVSNVKWTPGNTTTIPNGAQFSINNPLKVLILDIDLNISFLYFSSFLIYLYIGK